MTQTVAIGSTNKTKVGAITSALGHLNLTILPYATTSQQTHQPLSQAETRACALARAKECLDKTDADIAIGLESGVFFLDDSSVYLCEWGALADRFGAVYYSCGPIILMPSSFKEPLQSGMNLQDLMHQVTGIAELGKRQGAGGVFTSDMINRQETYSTIVKVLWGQYIYYSSVNSLSGDLK